MSLNDGMFTSESGSWGTPQALFDALNNAYHFQLDACALPQNAKCAEFIDPITDSLTVGWKSSTFMNPPYGRRVNTWKLQHFLPGVYEECLDNGIFDDKKLRKNFHSVYKQYVSDIGDWVAKAFTESTQGCTIVSLLPARTDTKWWHKYVMKHSTDVWFIEGRLKFEDDEGNPASTAAPFPSCIVIFDGKQSLIQTSPRFATFRCVDAVEQE